MANKGPLSKIEKFYIENNRHKGIEEVSKDLNRTKKIVSKHVDTLPKNDKIDMSVGDLMIRQDRGISVMTEHASILSDEKKVTATPVSSEPPSCVHRIKD